MSVFPGIELHLKLVALGTGAGGGGGGGGGSSSFVSLFPLSFGSGVSLCTVPQKKKCGFSNFSPNPLIIVEPSWCDASVE